MPLSPAAREALRGRIAHPSLHPFVEAVAGQLAHPPGHRAGGDAELAALARVTGVLASTDAGELARLLLRDPPLLAAVFQNLDLLPPGSHHLPSAVMAALELAASEPS